MYILIPFKHLPRETLRNSWLFPPRFQPPRRSGACGPTDVAAEGTLVIPWAFPHGWQPISIKLYSPQKTTWDVKNPCK